MNINRKGLKITTVSKILQDINNLDTSKGIELFKELGLVEHTDYANISDYVSKKRFRDGYICPHCGSLHIVRYSKSKGDSQRYLCKDCHKTVVATTNSIVSYTKKNLAVWGKYIDCMMNGLSIRRSAEIYKINRNTAFLWGHKILDALSELAENLELNGIVEADATFFHISYKGNHKNSMKFKMPRQAHCRGNDTHTRGISREQVCVPCAVDRNRQAYAKVVNMGKAGCKDIHFAFDGKIEKDVTLVTDGHNAYSKFAGGKNIDLIAIKKDHVKKEFIQFNISIITINN